jgi:hypothetical protein
VKESALAGRDWIFPHWGQNAAAFVGVLQLQQVVAETVADLGAFIFVETVSSQNPQVQIRHLGHPPKRPGPKIPTIKRQGWGTLRVSISGEWERPSCFIDLRK